LHPLATFPLLQLGPPYSFYNNFSALSILFTTTTEKQIARPVVYSLIWTRLSTMVATEKFCHVDPSFSSSPCSSLSDLCTDIRKPCQSFSLITESTDSRLILSNFLSLIKGTMSRDFRLMFFFLNQFPPCP
jgi:hypothetical protein